MEIRATVEIIDEIGEVHYKEEILSEIGWLGEPEDSFQGDIETAIDNMLEQYQEDTT